VSSANCTQQFSMRFGPQLQVETMRRLWLEEQEERQRVEVKAEAVRSQSARIWSELMRTEEVSDYVFSVYHFAASCCSNGGRYR
jgi:hypothetical protein